MTDLLPIPELHRSTYLAKGGFGEVFRDPRQSGMCIKRFKHPLVGQPAERLMRLIAIVATSRPSERAFLLSRFSWPVEAYGERGELHGYSMPEAPSATRFTLTVAKKQSDVLLQAKFLMDRQYWNSPAVTSLPPAISAAGRLQLAIDFHDALDFLHQRGLVYGDVSGNNICVKRGTVTRAFLLDADSIMTPEERRLDRAQSPDWSITAIEDPTAEDRAKFALFVWRLFRESPSELPDPALVQHVDTYSGANLGSLLISLYNTGRQDLFEALSLELRRALDASSRRNAVQLDLDEGFARRIALWPADLLDHEQRGARERADAQIELEHRLETLRGLERRMLLRTARSRPEFTLDLLSDAEKVSIPKTVAELDALLYSAEFAVLAEQFTTGQLGGFTPDPLVQRAVEHAISWTPAITPRVSSDFTNTEIRFDWPAEPWINALVLDVSVGGQVVRDVIRRGSGESTAVRQIRTNPSTTGTVRLTAASCSPDGRVVTGSDGTIGTFTTPTPPAPPRPPRGGTPGSNVPLQVLDPAVVLAQQQAAERQRRRKKRLRIALVVALIGLSGGGWKTYEVWTRPPALTVIDADGRRILSWSASEVGATTPDKVRMIQTRAAGDPTWSTQRRITEPDASNVVIEAPLVSLDYRLVEFRVDELAARGFGAVAVALAEIHDVAAPIRPPVVIDPRAEMGDSGVLVSWDVAPYPSSDPPVTVIEVSASWDWGSTTLTVIQRLGPDDRTTVFPVYPDAIDIQIRTINTLGLSSDWADTTLQNQG